MGQVMQLASFSLAEVQYITGDIRYNKYLSLSNRMIFMPFRNILNLVIKFKSLQNLLNYVFVPSKKTYLVLCSPLSKCTTRVAMVKYYFLCISPQVRILNIWSLTAFEFTGLGRGGQQIQRAKEVYTKAVETLVELASLQVHNHETLHHLRFYLQFL